MGAYEDWVAEFEGLSFCDKIRAVKKINDMCRDGDVEHRVTMLGYDGYLKTVEKYAVDVGSGEHYVYLWRHAWGDPFYVGSGKGDRWKSKSGRCNDFYLHLDQADAVVYRILTGVDLHTARLFEKYVSVNLIEAGCTLANGDNNTEYLSEDARKRRVSECATIDNHVLAGKVRGAVFGILNDQPRCDYRATDRFIMARGADYFSRNYWKKSYNRKEQVNV